MHEKQFRPAMQAFQKAIDQGFDLPRSYRKLGNAALEAGAVDEAVAAFATASGLEPRKALNCTWLSSALLRRGDTLEAAAAARRAIRLDAKDASAHANLGSALVSRRQLCEGIAELRQAIALDAKCVAAYNGLGAALRLQGDREGACGILEQALQLRAAPAEVYNTLGVLYAERGDRPRAIAALEHALQLKPTLAEAHRNLANVLLAGGGREDEAIAHLWQAVKLKPDFAEAHCSLGDALEHQGKFQEALQAHQRGHELGTKQPGWRYPSARWVRECEHLVELDRRLAAVLHRRARPKDAAEGLELACLCGRPCKRLHAAEARFYAEAFEARPELAEDVRQGHRYDAACAAALAGTGRGADAARLTEKERASWRRQALAWLRAELAGWAKELNAPASQARRELQQRVGSWMTDGDLAGVRGAALAGLPEAEHDGWSKLWADVERLLARAGTPKKAAFSLK
jgi:tetratricopeptide (TPR) repeat protein